MIVQDILNQISQKEGTYNYKQIPLNRWIKFKNAPIKEHIDFKEDINFQDFHVFLNKIFSCRVYKSVAIKILNNGYLI
ncbi:hypothetical protein [Clostridium butyricum]|uniref:hypothetical protein n=1 Tax=Clostridium butyricum TaxID=1492 RepID=UPI002AB0E3AD|nr:hypothetical protein [Clostridium butyricum]